MVSQSPTVKLSTGQQMPQLGLGTWMLDPKKAPETVFTALELGYRLIDGALIYENEKEVGEGIHRAMDEKLVSRDDIFVVSKLWNTYHRKELVAKGIDETLASLKLNNLDLFLMHWPISMPPGEGLWPKDGDNAKLEDVDLMTTWTAMEELVKSKKTKAIGCCNMNKSQLQEILEKGSIRPAVLQIEVHPLCYEADLLEFCKKENIHVMAYSPFGHGDATCGLFENKTIKEVANNEQLSPAQILLLWNLSQERIVIPKASSREHLKENFEFLTKMHELPKDEVAKVQQLTKGKQIRTCDPEKFFGVKIF
eukprot:NODE_481_length_6950_cov_0.533353.p2 type:complete len:309 gc:universal NODE_481_length_6950_cov_0.533353:3176-4102(+)